MKFLMKFTVGRFPSHDLFSTLTLNMVMAMFYYSVENQSINLLNINMPLIFTNCFMNKKFKSLVVLFLVKIYIQSRLNSLSQRTNPQSN